MDAACNSNSLSEKSFSPTFGITFLVRSVALGWALGFAFRSWGCGARRGPFHFHARTSAVLRKGASGCVVQHLRHPSPRPSVVVDPAAFGGLDPSSGRLVGRPGPFGRERVMSALPLDPGPCLLSPPTVVHDAGSSFLADPDGALIGEPAVWVGRMLTGRWTEDTRRF